MDVVDWRARRGDPAALIPATSEGPFEHHVLMIENDPDVLFAFAERLRLWGARVIGAGSGAEALARLEDGMRPDIVLADYHLDGGATGLGAVATLRDVCGAHLPAILVTADRSEALRREAARADIAVIPKPVKLAHLRLLINWTVWRAGIPTKVSNDSAPRSPRLGPGKGDV
jgi:CheY-like chemotaxis protein